ncbi:MAG: response regulator transcription factor [Saprospiraceae bacterium]
MPDIKILYVEDEPFLSKIVCESLESRSFEIRLVEDGALVMAAFEQFQPDICVLDVMLPNRDGFSLAQEIRGKYPILPMLFLTAKSQTADVVQGFESGGNDYLRKPFSLEELIVRVHNLLRLTNSTPAPKLETDALAIGRYRFFPNRQELRLDGQARQLSHRETQLLEILARHPNQAVPRRDILEQVWGHDSFFNSRNLDVYITRLRDRLQADPGVQLLTLKGVGYRLVCNHAG